MEEVGQSLWLCPDWFYLFLHVFCPAGSSCLSGWCFWAVILCSLVALALFVVNNITQWHAKQGAAPQPIQPTPGPVFSDVASPIAAFLLLHHMPAVAPLLHRWVKLYPAGLEELGLKKGGTALGS